MPRTPPRVTLCFPRVLRAIVVGQMQAFAFGHMRWPNAAHPLTSPIRFGRGGAQRLLSECEPPYSPRPPPSRGGRVQELGHLHCCVSSICRHGTYANAGDCGWWTHPLEPRAYCTILRNSFILTYYRQGTYLTCISEGWKDLFERMGTNLHAQDTLTGARWRGLDAQGCARPPRSAPRQPLPPIESYMGWSRHPLLYI